MHSIRPYPNELFSALAFTGFILCCIPSCLHLRGKSVPVAELVLIVHLILHITWIGLSCLNAFVSSIVWNSNTVNWAPIWCDTCMCPYLFSPATTLTYRVATRLMGGALVAIPSTSFRITRHLYLISHASHATFTERVKPNQRIFYLGVGIGIPKYCT